MLLHVNTDQAPAASYKPFHHHPAAHSTMTKSQQPVPQVLSRDTLLCMLSVLPPCLLQVDVGRDTKLRDMDEKHMHNLFLKNMSGLIEETKNPSPCLNP